MPLFAVTRLLLPFPRFFSLQSYGQSFEAAHFGAVVAAAAAAERMLGYVVLVTTRLLMR
jgi:hypothetical protein